MSNFKLLALFLLSIVVFFNATSYAIAQEERLHPSAKKYSKKKNSNKGKSEGSYLSNRLNMVLRLGVGIPNGDTDVTVNGTPAAGSVSEIAESKLYGGSVGVNYRLHQYISLESTIGLQKGNAFEVRSLATGAVQDEGSLYAIPTTISVLFHAGNFSGFKPYIGAGYHYTFAFSTLDGVEPSNGNGALFRAGFDVKMDKKTTFNFDVEHRLMDIDIDYTEALGGLLNVKERANMDTTTFSVGVKFKF